MKTDLVTDGSAAIGGDVSAARNVRVGGDLRVEGWLEARNIKGAFKGLYADEEALTDQWPRPAPGWFALTGDTLPATLWRAGNRRWENCGVAPETFSTDMQQYKALLDDERNGRKSGEAAIRALVDDERADRESGEAALRALIDDERADRESGEAALRALIDDERADRENAEAALRREMEEKGESGEAFGELQTRLAALDRNLNTEAVTHRDFDATDRYINAANGEETAGKDFSYLIVEVKEGDTLDIHTFGGANARAWIMLDSAGKVVKTTENTGGEAEESITVPGGVARVAVNCRQAGYEWFEVKVNARYPSVANRLAALDERIDSERQHTESRVEELRGEIAADSTASLLSPRRMTLDTGIEPTAFNTARIVADTTMSFADGDRLVAVAVRGAKVPAANSVASEVRVYDSEGNMQAQRELGVITTDGEHRFELAEPLRLTSGCRVAVRGTGWVTRESGSRFHDYNTGTTADAYSYSFALEIERDIFDPARTDPALAEGLDRLKEAEETLAALAGQSRRRLSLLCLGNSFTLDALGYVPWMMENLVPGLELTVGILHSDSCGLAQHAANLSGEPRSAGDKTFTPSDYTLSLREAGAEKWRSTAHVNAADVLASRDWDIVTLQQNGAQAFADWDVWYETFLREITAHIAAAATSPVRLGWLLTHGAYATDAETLRQHWQGTADNARKVMESGAGIDLLVPYGTAVELLRGETADGTTDSIGLTSDTRHLQAGIGCMAAAYSVCLSLLEAAGEGWRGIIGEPTRPDREWITAHDVPGVHYGSGGVAGISEENCLAAQRCAVAARHNPYG